MLSESQELAKKRAEYRASLDAMDSANQLKEESQMQRRIEIAQSHSPMKSSPSKVPPKNAKGAAAALQPPVMTAAEDEEYDDFPDDDDDDNDVNL